MIQIGQGLQVRNRTIKRGSQLSYNVSIGESSNLCILGIIIFLGSYLAFLLVRFWCLSCSTWQDQVHRKRISYGKLLAFWVLEFLRVVLQLRDNTFHHLVFKRESGFHRKTKRHQRGTWEVRNLGEDDWSRGDNQSDLKPGKRVTPILVLKVLQKKVLILDMSLLYLREENSISKYFLQQRYRYVAFSMPKSLVFKN